jgi:hypothetical protein
VVLHEEMEVRLALRSRPAGGASNHPLLRWLKTVVVSEREKAHRMRQVGIGETVRSSRAWCGGRC